jgi:hypothetical protein
MLSTFIDHAIYTSSTSKQQTRNSLHICLVHCRREPHLVLPIHGRVSCQTLHPSDTKTSGSQEPGLERAHHPYREHRTMALPKTLQPSLTPDELTFLAEEEMIDIVPLFSMTPVRLMSVSSDFDTDSMPTPLYCPSRLAKPVISRCATIKSVNHPRSQLPDSRLDEMPIGLN